MCPTCRKDAPIYCKKVCRRCYQRAFQKEKRANLRSSWWKIVEFDEGEKNDIRILLLRFKYCRDSEIDNLKLVHYYFKYKHEELPDFGLFSFKKMIVKIKKELSSIFL